MGTEPEVQVATVFSNHLTNAILKYFTESGRLLEGAAFFKPLLEKDPEVAAILSRSYLGTDEEVRAVEIMHKALTQSTVSYGVLLVQIEFLRGKVFLFLIIRGQKGLLNRIFLEAKIRLGIETCQNGSHLRAVRIPDMVGAHRYIH